MLGSKAGLDSGISSGFDCAKGTQPARLIRDDLLRRA